jgi:hypothetical protein
VPVEQLTALIQVLLAGCGGTGDETVRSDVQRGLVVGQWSGHCLVRNSHGLRSSEDASSLVVPQFQPALVLVVRPARVADDFGAETAFRAVGGGPFLQPNSVELTTVLKNFIYPDTKCSPAPVSRPCRQVVLSESTAEDASKTVIVTVVPSDVSKDTPPPRVRVAHVSCHSPSPVPC